MNAMPAGGSQPGLPSLPSRLLRARRALVASAAARALIVALLVALGVVGIGLALDALVGLPLGLRRALLPVAVLGGALALARGVLGPVRAAWGASDEMVALWFERRLPALRYALVTSVDPRFADAVPALERSATAAPLEREVALATRAALLRPALIAGALAIAVLVLPGGAVARVLAPAAGDALDRPGAASRAVADPLATIVVRVAAPAYSGIAAATYDDPSTVAALAGSRIRVEGRGAGVRAVVRRDSLRADTLAARADGEGWSIALPLPARAAAVRLLGPARERVLVLDPVADSVPSARLEEPARDSVLRAARGTVLLRAELRDDHGLADGAFEFIVSSGAGETFTFRSGRVAARTFAAGARTASLEGSLTLDTLKLGPGDLIHLRAVARDRNDVTGPGNGASETRTLRIARADEYDSVAVDPMPPTEPEKNALSQRMILIMTEALRARQPRIGAAELQREAKRIAIEQTRLRKRVGEVVFIRLGEDAGEHAHFAGDGHEHGQEGPLNPEQILAAAERASNRDASQMLDNEGDETPLVALNRPLLEAYNHMWRASTELEVANPGAAIPWMQRAIEALQRARAAERIYLRGRPPRVVVDLAKVRGTGKEQGVSTARTARAPADAERAARLARFDLALGLLVADPAAAADSLLLLRLTVPDEERAAARALDAAAEQVRRGGDVTGALGRARRALAGVPVRRAGLSSWGR